MEKFLPYTNSALKILKVDSATALSWGKPGESGTAVMPENRDRGWGAVRAQMGGYSPGQQNRDHQ